MTTKPETVSVRIRSEQYVQAAEIADHVKREGWASIGVDSPHTASITSVITAAIEQLHRKVKK